MEAIQGYDQREVGELTDDDLDVIAGKRDQLVGRIQERYGIAREAAQQQVGDYVKRLREEQREDEKAKQKERARGVS